MPFSYFGTKGKLVKHYPEPQYGSIIEPFAGAAAYSVRYFDRDIWINDLDPTIYRIWLWIRSATRTDIRGLPELEKGDKLSDIKSLSADERALLGFAISQGVARPKNTVTEWAAKKNNVKLLKQKLARIAGRISHWTITNLGYPELDNERATWFVDPPYQHLGSHYKFSNKDMSFKHLGKWCLRRKGQLIVCEAEGADWLPFKLMKDIAESRIRRKDSYREVIFYRSDRTTGFGFA
jgi:site-specific DNA-adenine methylase